MNDIPLGRNVIVFQEKEKAETEGGLVKVSRFLSFQPFGTIVRASPKAEEWFREQGVQGDLVGLRVRFAGFCGTTLEEATEEGVHKLLDVQDLLAYQPREVTSG